MVNIAGRPREPIELLIAKGKKHLTQEEIEERRKSEIKTSYINVKPPEYLSEFEKKEFKRITTILLDIGIINELDEDCLARYLISNTNYINYTKKLRALNLKLLTAEKTQEIKKIESEIDLYLTYQDRALKQCRNCANDLGLSISSRAKLIMPPSKDPPKTNKFEKFKGGTN